MGHGWRIGRVAGIELAIHPSWLVIAFLVTYSLAVGAFPSQYPGWPTSQYWVVAAATAALFFGSVLAHELSHALVARRFGLKVEGITLFIFGGVTTIAANGRDGMAGPLPAAGQPTADVAPANHEDVHPSSLSLASSGGRNPSQPSRRGRRPRPVRAYGAPC